MIEAEKQQKVLQSQRKKALTEEYKSKLKAKMAKVGGGGAAQIFYVIFYFCKM